MKTWNLQKGIRQMKVRVVNGRETAMTYSKLNKNKSSFDGLPIQIMISGSLRKK